MKLAGSYEGTYVDMFTYLVAALVLLSVEQLLGGTSSNLWWFGYAVCAPLQTLHRKPRELRDRGLQHLEAAAAAHPELGAEPE